MRRKTIALSCLVCLALLSNLAFAADVPSDAQKRTRLGKYVTAVEAYAMYLKDKDHVTIIDVRTPEEYDLVGHPAMARNIPVMLRTGQFDPAKKNYGLAPNRDFVDRVKAVAGKSDLLVVLCRSGQRSAAAANKLAEAGFTDVWSMVDGFEGEKVADKDSPDYGKRVRDGWKNTGSPWTYDLDPALVYIVPVN
ncbi:rhodanese-like domain-containing protein [Solidesulfovibrio sp.]|uniref:rhodanese-like domain-containing protein n=1 Tax=Solidesulfovibrio sp. TaxID=2910990 RepID=UPI002610D77C|nr:rhodanese-like domain-containing protein [Solidesulfovibrio sp.]